MPEEATKAVASYFAGTMDGLEVVEVLRALKKKLPAAADLLRP